MTELKREEIVGQTIRCVQASEERRDDLDFTLTFYTLKSGVVFFMPLACSPFVAAAVPSNARLLKGPVVARCLASPILRVLAIQDEDGWIDPDSLVMQLVSGDCLTDCNVAPHGTGLSGLRLFHPGELDLSHHRDYWTLDFAADERALKKHLG